MKYSMTKVSPSGKNSNYSPFKFGNTGVISPVIDSLKIRLEKDQITVINPILQDEFAVVSTTTGHIIDDDNFKKSAFFHEYNGIKTYYRIEKQVSRDKSVKEYVTVLVSSKALEDQYFDGICGSTIERLYSNLIDHKVIWCNQDTFYSGECTDVDIKIDFVPEGRALDVINSLYAQVKPQKLAHKAASVYRQKKNLGIQYALRKTQCFQTSPYLKVYEKVRELTYKSHVFKEAYLSGIKLPDEVLRVETTIKNRKHFTALGQKSTRLIDIVNNLPKVSEIAYKRAFEAHLGAFQQAAVSQNARDLKPMDKALVLLITEKMLSGNDFLLAKEIVIQATCVDKKQRYRMGKRIDRLAKHVDFSKFVQAKENESLYYEFIARFSTN